MVSTILIWDRISICNFPYHWWASGCAYTDIVKQYIFSSGFSIWLWCRSNAKMCVNFIVQTFVHMQFKSHCKFLLFGLTSGIPNESYFEDGKKSLTFWHKSYILLLKINSLNYEIPVRQKSAKNSHAFIFLTTKNINFISKHFLWHGKKKSHSLVVVAIIPRNDRIMIGRKVTLFFLSQDDI